MKKRKIRNVLYIIASVILVACLTACNASADVQKEHSDVQTEHVAEAEAETFETTEANGQTGPVDEESTAEQPEATEPSEDSKSEATNSPEGDKPEATNSSDDDKSEVTGEATLATPSTAGALCVKGTQLTDSKGNPVQLRGISTHGLSWFPQYVNQELFHELRNDWKANVMRLAMYTAENGGYCTDGNKDKLKQLVKDGVQYATNADMYVMIDWHVLRDEDPNRNKDEAKQFFEEMSKEYAGADNVIYEICNEPNGATSWADVKAYALEIIPIIRANDKDALIIVGTPTWSQDVDKAAADPITEYDNIMYSLHFYATTHTDWLRDRMNQALDSGLPIFVSEFGTCDASGNGAFDEYQSNEWIKALDARGVSYVTWNLSNKNETSSIFSAGCSKTSGFTTEDLSQNGKWIYKLLTGNRKVGDLTAGDGKEEKSSEKNSSEKQGDSKENTSGKEPVADSVSGTSNDLKYTAVVTGSWEADGKTFYQYTLTLENVSGKKLDGWEMEMVFSDKIEFSDGWNGEYKVEEARLKISSKDYNRMVEPGGKVQDVGFIISSNPQLTIEK